VPRQIKGRNGGTLNLLQKGETANPNGRPRKLPELDKLCAEVLGEEKDGTTAIETILKVLRAKAAKGDLRAAELLLDRAYGRARQGVDLSAVVTQFPSPVIELPNEQPNEAESETGSGMAAT
jgi:Family of unknown function (DUF5681)